MRLLPLLLAAMPGCLVPASPNWDAASSEVLHLQLETLFAAIDKNDMVSLADAMDESVVFYDVDIDGRPVVAYDKVATTKVLERLNAQRQIAGGTLKSFVSAATCHATTAMGFCAIEFQQELTRDGARTGPFRYRGTLVARYLDGRWRWVQWNLSPLDPAVVAQPAAPAAHGGTVEAVPVTVP